MCLDNKLRTEEKNRWLKNTAKVVTAYKVVRLRPIPEYIKLYSPDAEDVQIRMYPMYDYTPAGKSFKRNNILRELKNKKHEKYIQTHYGGTDANLPVHYAAYFQ